MKIRFGAYPRLCISLRMTRMNANKNNKIRLIIWIKTVFLDLIDILLIFIGFIRLIRGFCVLFGFIRDFVDIFWFHSCDSRFNALFRFIKCLIDTDASLTVLRV